MKNILLVLGLMLSFSVMAEQPAQGQIERDISAQPQAEMNQSISAQPAAENTEQAATQQESLQEMSGFSRGSVMRSAFTTAINEREPAEKLSELTNEQGQVMFFTELRDMSGQKAMHRWEYDGKVVAEVEFNVQGPRWRVWSSKTLSPDLTGEWKVSVLNAAGEVIAEDKLNYVAAQAEPAPESLPPAAQ